MVNLYDQFKGEGFLMAPSNKKKRNRNLKRSNKSTRGQRRSVVMDSTKAMGYVKKIVDLLKPWELSRSQRFKTYWQMLGDDAVWSSVSARIVAIETSQSKSTLKYDKNSDRSKELRDFIAWNIHNMSRTTRAIGRDASEMVYNGVAPFEIVTQLQKEGVYEGLFTLKDVSYIDPITLDTTQPYQTAKDGRVITNLRQMSSAFVDTTSGDSSFSRVRSTYKDSGIVDIDYRKVCMASYSASDSRPFGTSDLDAAYTPWREKVLIQDYLLMGIQKDLAGTPVLRVPQQLFDEAKDPNSDAAKTLQGLQEHMTNLHAGDQTFVILPSDTFSDNGAGNQLYDINFKGVDGTSKMFNLVEIIEQKKKAIYNVLGTQSLLTGENGGGSYNLLEGQAGQQAHLAERDNIIIDEMWNNKIIPMILNLNGFNDELPTDIPKYCHGEVQPLSLDEYGKFINRTARLLPATPDVGNALLSRMGVDYRLPEGLTPEEYREMLFDFAEPSKVGSGEGSSGTGDSQQGGGSSDNNSENAS